MKAAHHRNSFARAAHAVESALLAVVLRHYGLELRQEERDDAPGASRPEHSAQTPGLH
jgi:hypothetical protein